MARNVGIVIQGVVRSLRCLVVFLSATVLSASVLSVNVAHGQEPEAPEADPVSEEPASGEAVEAVQETDADGAGSGQKEAAHQEAAAPKAPAPFVFTPGPGVPGVVIPREERLVYKAYLEVGIVETHVGTVTQLCSVERQAQPIILASPRGSVGEAASIRLDASGSYLFYELKSTLETRVLPQEWPRLFYQQSTESSRGLRRREVMVGLRDGVPTSSYRGDTSKGAPKGTRIWKGEEYREVPEGTVDMLTAVFMARALMRTGEKAITFPLVDKNRVWKLTLQRGEERRMETGAGAFDVVEVVLQPGPYPGESFPDKAKEFEGVFGIKGSMHLWVDRTTGIAVRIQGDLPVSDGLIVLGVDVILDSFSGTPEDFAPLSEEDN